MVPLRASRHREYQDGRGHVEGIHGRFEQPHGTETPDDGEERGHQREDQSLEGAKGLVVDESDHDNGEGEEELGALGITLELGQEDGASAHRHLHGRIARPLDDGLDLAHNSLKAGGVRGEVCQDRRGAGITRNDRVDVDGIVVDGLAHRGDFRLPLRYRIHEG